jgi:hypothetical protein
VADLALGFPAGILAGAQKLAQLAHLRRDVLLPVLQAIQRMGSQSRFTPFFQGCTSAGKNLATFRPRWRGCLERRPGRPGGYVLDLDSTRLLHEDGHQEGVQVGYTRLGTKPCLQPGTGHALQDPQTERGAPDASARQRQAQRRTFRRWVGRRVLGRDGLASALDQFPFPAAECLEINGSRGCDRLNRAAALRLGFLVHGKLLLAWGAQPIWRSRFG